MPDENTAAASNALGLEFTNETPDNVHTSPTIESSVTSPPANPTQEQPTKPYLNPNRVKTGGNPREKPSEEALEERMLRIREQNEKIKQRRLDVLKDEEAFRKTQEQERAKAAHQRKVRNIQDKQREANAKRKLERAEGREWDSEKLNKVKKPVTTPSKEQNVREAAEVETAEHAAEGYDEEEEYEEEEEDDWRLPAAPENYAGREFSNKGGKKRRFEYGNNNFFGPSVDNNSAIDPTSNWANPGEDLSSAWGVPEEADAAAKWSSNAEETNDAQKWETSPAGSGDVKAGDQSSKKFGLAKGAKKDKQRGGGNRPSEDADATAAWNPTEHSAAAWGDAEETSDKKAASTSDTPTDNWASNEATEGVTASRWASNDSSSPLASDRGRGGRGRGRGERGGRGGDRGGRGMGRARGNARVFNWNPDSSAAADWGRGSQDKKDNDTSTDANVSSNWGAEPPAISDWGIEPTHDTADAGAPSGRGEREGRARDEGRGRVSDRGWEGRGRGEYRGRGGRGEGRVRGEGRGRGAWDS